MGGSGSASVYYSTSKGTASAGSDYTANSGYANFLDGSLTTSFSVPITDDSTVESAETVNLNLGMPSSGYSLGLSSARFRREQRCTSSRFTPVTGGFSRISRACMYSTRRS